MIQRFLLAALSCSLAELATSSAAGLFAPGTELLFMIGTAAGLLLSALWTGRGFYLILAGAIVAETWGFAAAHVWEGNGGSLLILIHAGQRSSIDGTAIFLLATVCTALGGLCGWMLFHAREPWPVVALYGSCLLLRADVNAAYADAFPLLAFALLCLVGVTLAGRHLVPIRIAIAAALAGVAVVLGWQLPTAASAWSRGFIDPLRTLGPRSVPIAGQTSLSLAGPFQPTNHVVISIWVPQRLSHPYWWAGIYSTYDGSSWAMTGYDIRRVERGARLDTPPALGGPPIPALIHTYEPTTNLVFPGSPQSASMPAYALTQQTDGQTVQVLTTQALASGSTYWTTGVAGLHSRGNVGPEPPSRTYLQLPAVPARVRSLALSLTRGGDVVSKITRVQRYLAASGQFVYSTQAGSVPGRDAADYFLFDSRRGYCNQFATAMAVVLREVGIPSRLVSGFVAGTLRDGRYVLQEKDAHSWVQAYVPDRGWVDFEPTPGFALASGRTIGQGGQPAPGRVTVRARGTVTIPQVRPTAVGVRPPQPGSSPARRNDGPLSSPLPWLLTALLLGLVGVVVVAVRRPRSASDLYRRLPGRGILRARPLVGETPRQFTLRAFTAPRDQRDAMIVTELYMLERYGARRLPAADFNRARAALRRLRRSRLRPRAGGNA